MPLPSALDPVGRTFVRMTYSRRYVKRLTSALTTPRGGTARASTRAPWAQQPGASASARHATQALPTHACADRTLESTYPRPHLSPMHLRDHFY
jgi:hypothetical protein